MLESDLIDVKLDANGDIDLSSGSIQFTNGIDAVVQGIKVRLQTVRGELFLNLDEGVPYYEDIFGQRFDEPRIRAAFRGVILSAPGVVELLSLNASFDRSTRQLAVTWAVRTEFGDSSDSLILDA